MAQPNPDPNSPADFHVPVDDKKPTPIPCNRRGSGPVRLIFTHGAGGTLTSDGIANFSSGFTKPSTSSIVCFQGNMHLKSRAKMFDLVHDKVVETFDCKTPLALGGRSMGARAAVLAAMPDTKCLILASYPLQTEKEVRDQILLDLPSNKDVLFISGDHDSMCDLELLNEVRAKMKARTWMIRVRDADHGMSVRPKKATRAIGEDTGLRAAEWLLERNEEETECEIWWGVDENGEERVHSGPWAKEVKAGVQRESKPDSAKANTTLAQGIKKDPATHKGTKAKLSKTTKADGNKEKPPTNGKKKASPVPGLRRSKRQKVNT